MQDYNEQRTANRMNAYLEERSQAIGFIIGWALITVFTSVVLAYFTYYAGKVALWVVPVWFLYGGPFCLISDIRDFRSNF